MLAVMLQSDALCAMPSGNPMYAEVCCAHACRSQLAVMAALLHDVVDDTRIDFAEVEAAFGAPTAALVATVTRLSQMNQLMRRKARKAREQVGHRVCSLYCGVAGYPLAWHHTHGDTPPA